VYFVKKKYFCKNDYFSSYIFSWIKEKTTEKWNKTTVERLKILQEKEKKAEKWLAEWNKKQTISITENEETNIEKPKKNNFDRLIGCGG